MPDIYGCIENRLSIVSSTYPCWNSSLAEPSRMRHLCCKYLNLSVQYFLHFSALESNACCFTEYRCAACVFVWAFHWYKKEISLVPSHGQCPHCTHRSVTHFRFLDTHCPMWNCQLCTPMLSSLPWCGGYCQMYSDDWL